MKSFINRFVLPTIGIITTVIFISCSKKENTSTIERIPLEFRLVREVEYGEGHEDFYEWCAKRNITDFTYWETTNSFIRNYEIESFDSIVEPLEDFDYENYTLLITYGRKVAELEYYDTGPPIMYSAMPGLVYPFVMLVTVFEPEYHGFKAFFYEIEKQPYQFSEWHAGCYLLVNGERIFIGASAEDMLTYFN